MPDPKTPANPPAPDPAKPAPAPAPPAPEPEKQTPEQIAQQIADAAVAAQAPPKPAAAPPAEPPKEIEYTASNGIKFRGKDTQDIIAQLDKSMVHGSSEITRLKNMVRAGAGDPAAADPNAPQPFQTKRYFELMVSEKEGEGPLAAQRYALAHMFNIPEDRVVPAITDAVEEAVDYRQRKVLNEFLVANPDFPGDQASVDALWQKMIDNDSPMTPAAFRTAHQACMQEHKYEPYVAEPGQPAAPGYATTGEVRPGAPTPPLPLPRASASAGATPPNPAADVNEKAMSEWTPEQIKAYMDRVAEQGRTQ